MYITEFHHCVYNSMDRKKKKRSKKDEKVVWITFPGVPGDSQKTSRVQDAMFTLFGNQIQVSQ